MVRAYPLAGALFRWPSTLSALVASEENHRHSSAGKLGVIESGLSAMAWTGRLAPLLHASEHQDQ